MDDPVLVQARSHADAGRTEQALQIIRRALDKAPANRAYLEPAIALLVRLGRIDQAQFLIARAAGQNPRDPAILKHGADLEIRRKRYAEAEQFYRRALTLEPTNIETMASVAAMMYHQGRVDEAWAFARRMYEANPTDYRTVSIYAGYAEMLGDLDEAVRVLRRMLDHSPNDLPALQALMIPMVRMHGLDPAVILQYHVRLGSVLTHLMRDQQRPHPNTPDPERPLRIGYCSQDFRNRSVGHFIEPILAHHDKSKFSIELYHHVISEDELTARLRGHAALYVPTQKLGESALIERIRSDRIDILIDLSGYTSGSRQIIALAAKPAPIQYTYLGYPNTTALPAMDYRIVDWHTDPAGSEHLATEKLVRMEGCFLCYTPPPHGGDVAPPPSLTQGHVTFGSFNTITKVGNPVLDVWARVLLEVPGSRLLLKSLGLSSPLTRERIWTHLASRGIARDRVELLEETKGKHEHLAMYGKVDIALDTWPYNGTTTTVEALYMGVPVIGLEGRTHVSRVGISLLNAVGLPDLLAKDEDDYVRTAVALASDQSRRIDLRSTLRDSVLKGPLCDHAGFTRRLEEHYRGAWRDWCARKQADPSL